MRIGSRELSSHSYIRPVDVRDASLTGAGEESYFTGHQKMVSRDAKKYISSHLSPNMVNMDVYCTRSADPTSRDLESERLFCT